MAKIQWNENGWTSLQDANREAHNLSIDCRAEDGKVVEVRIRHHDGEEVVVKTFLNGEPALPMDIKTFAKHYAKLEFDFKE